MPTSFYRNNVSEKIFLMEFCFSADQVFIGHSENVCRIHFTPDDLSLISAGEAVYIWDFMAKRAAVAPV